MASYYKYKEREASDQVDWRNITKTITDDMATITADREQQRVDIDKAVQENLSEIANAPKGTLTLENQNIANYAEQASAFALEQQKALKSGSLSLKEYLAGSNTSIASTKKLFGLSKKYQDNYKIHMDSLQDGTGSVIGAVLAGSVEKFGLSKGTSYYMDPVTGDAYLTREAQEGDKNTRLISGKAMSIMDVSTAEGIIARNVNKFQADEVSTSIADGIGKSVEILIGEAAQAGKTLSVEDAKRRLFEADGDTLSKEGKAIMLSVKAQMGTDIQIASMLMDTVGGYSMISKGTDGTYTNLQTQETADPSDTSIEFKLDENGVYQPVITDKLKAEAEKGVLDMIKLKTDYVERQVSDTGMDDAQKEAARLARERLRLDKKKADKGKNKQQSAMSNLTKLFYGGKEDAGAAAKFIRGLDKNKNLQIRLDGPNMILTRTLSNGDTEVETISKEGGIRNFVESASTFLNLGIDDVQEAMSASGALKDKEGNDLVMNPISLDSSSVITKKVSTIDQVQDLISSDIDGIKLSDTVVKDETDLRDALAPMLAKYGVNIAEKEGGYNVLEFTLGEKTIRVPLKEATPSSIRDLVKNLINSDVTKDTLITYKAKLRDRTQDETGSGVGGKYNPK